MVKDQDRYFLVSAKHVLKEARKDQRLFMPMTRRTLDLSRLVCASWDVDVAVCDLSKRWPLPQSLNEGALPLAFNHDDRTELSQIPPPNGMSGSPVWLAYEVGEDLSNQKPFSVIGVFIQYWDEYQAAIAVHIKEVVKLMLLSRAIWH
jgi:hypothetical protein